MIMMYEFVFPGKKSECGASALLAHVATTCYETIDDYMSGAANPIPFAVPELIYYFVRFHQKSFSEKAN